MSPHKSPAAQEQTPQAPSLKQRAARSKAGIRRVAMAEASPAVDWNKPPPGFMASPAIEPFGFVEISKGLRTELERLHSIALEEFQRQSEHLREHVSDEVEIGVREDEIRRDLLLTQLALAVPCRKVGLFERNLSSEAFDYAWAIDLLPVRTEDLVRLYDVFAQAAETLDAVAYDDQFLIQTPRGHRHTAGGLVVEAEDNRLACLRDAIADELARRRPHNEAERDDILNVRIRHEMRCEDKIRDRALLAEITAAWGG